MKEAKQRYTNINSKIINGYLHEAIESLEKEFSIPDLLVYNEMLNECKEIYGNLLEYTFKGVDDPKRDSIYVQLQKDLLELNDKIRDRYIKLSRSEERNNETISFTITSKINEIISLKKESENEKRKSLFDQLFTKIFFSNILTGEDVDSIKKFVRGNLFFIHEKSIIVSAVTMSLLGRFDAQKFNLLLNFYDANEQQTRNRAIVGIVFAFYFYDQRIHLYKDIINRSAILSDDSESQSFIRDIIFQLIRTKETTMVSDKLKNEILPEMAKLQPKIDEKLNLDQIASDSLIEDQNPDWEKVFEDTPDLLNKMEEISKMQLEGTDVFMSAFSLLKHFDFFDHLSNWFLPFYKENSDAISAFDMNDKVFNYEVFLEGLERSSYICNSDKYSFCLNVKAMPSAQKKMLVDLFKMEIQQMNEISTEDELLNKSIKDRHIFTTYIQDLYRFYKLNLMRILLPDIFEMRLDIHNTFFYKTIIKNDKLKIAIADFYFEKSYWQEAVEIYISADVKGKIARKIYEKTGFAFQRIGNFENALKYYQISELYGENSLWLTKKIAFCYRKLKTYDKALDYYQKAEIEQPENLHIQVNIAHCLLSLEKFEEAQKYYFKVLYFDDENIPVMRPIAWCSFMLGKYDSAEKYYLKILERKPTGYDFMNYAHLLFCLNKKQESSAFYIKSAQIIGLSKFNETLQYDSKFLVEKGILKNEILLLQDFVMTKL